MKISDILIASALLVSAIPCIAGPFGPPPLPRACFNPNIARQTQQLQADQDRRRMEQTLREQRERYTRERQKEQEAERREKETLKTVRETAPRPPQK